MAYLRFYIKMYIFYVFLRIHRKQANFSYEITLRLISYKCTLESFKLVEMSIQLCEDSTVKSKLQLIARASSSSAPIMIGIKGKI